MTDTFALLGTKHVIDKDPDAVLDYSFDWTPWLRDDGDQILTHTMIVESDAGAIVVDNSAIFDTTIPNSMVTAFVSGGRPGVKEPLTCRIVTVAGRTDDRTVFLKILER